MRWKTLYWFRRGGALRLLDNLSLDRSLVGTEVLYPVYVLSGGDVRRGSASVLFLLEALQELDLELRGLGSRLFVFKGEPENVLPVLLRRWGVSRIGFSSAGCDPSARGTCTKVAICARQVGVQIIQEEDHLLGTPMQIENTSTVDFLQKRVATMDPLPTRTTPKPCALPPPQLDSHDGELQRSLSSLPQGIFYPRTPTLSELGAEAIADGKRSLFFGGESHGIARMEMWMASVPSVALYNSHGTNPCSLNPSSTALSPYLAIGSLSPRVLWRRIEETIAASKLSSTIDPLHSLKNQLLRREFCHKIGSTDRLASQEVSVPWISGEEADRRLGRWKYGQTGYPLVDAAMLQLRQHGWIHHTLRELIACFATRGDLFLSWRRVMEVFTQLSIDYDWAINTYWCKWVSCAAYDVNFRLVPNPVTLAQQYDLHGEYVKHFLPVLRRFDRHFVWDPSAAPRPLQIHNRCIVGVDYPERIVDHRIAARKNVAVMRSILKDNAGSSRRKG